jgi:ABC-type uncharacterized transport system involved in gliding motility auxiliary subunit
MNTAWLKARQTRFTAYVTAYIAIIIAVLSLANFLANRHNKSIDTTTNKRFSLSDQTAKVVKNLNQDVTLRYYDQTSKFAQARDLLDRYDNLSARLKVEYIDPDKKPQQAKADGVKSMGTLFVQSSTKKEEARSITEEEVTGALIRALKGGERNVCLVSGSGEHPLDGQGRESYSQAKELVERNNYKSRTISLLEKQAGAQTIAIPKDCTVLVIGGPKYDYLEPAVNAIKSYVEGGGRALIMVDPPLKIGNENTGENAALLKLLESWGVTLQKNLVLDTSGIGQLFGLSAVVPLVTSYGSHAIVRETKEVATAFPLARSLEVKNGDKTTVETLFSTGGNSFATTNLSSAEISQGPNDKKGPLPIGAAGTYNTGQENHQGRFVVVGSSGWIANGILRFNGNRDLFLNMMNWLSSDEDLISIRPKDPEDRRLSLSRSQMNAIFYLSVIGLPLMVVAAGLGVWWRRR